MTERTYADPCGIARALDVVGERWALLIVRELLLGAKRFTDLRTGLPSASPNVLSQRVRELERTGVVGRRRLPPPAGVWVYELTEQGRGLQRVLMALGVWGSNLVPVPRGEPSADALILALCSRFEGRSAGSLRGIVEIRLGDETFVLNARDGHLEARRAGMARPDVTLSTTVRDLRRVAFGDLAFEEALQSGVIRMSGDRRLAARLLGSIRNSSRTRGAATPRDAGPPQTRPQGRASTRTSKMRTWRS